MEAQKYFQALFCSTNPYYSYPFSVYNTPRLDDEGERSLISPVSKEEVAHALNSMNPYKAPGPDGFQALFFRQYWHV